MASEQASSVRTKGGETAADVVAEMTTSPQFPRAAPSGNVSERVWGEGAIKELPKARASRTTKAKLGHRRQRVTQLAEDLAPHGFKSETQL